MGISLFKVSNSSTPDPNPNPSKFIVLRMEPVGTVTVAEVQYQGCTNYEGRKILVLKLTPAEIHKLAQLDPHFNEGSPLIARFRPTELGWQQAKWFAKGVQ